jgi:hypothetical protein
MPEPMERHGESAGSHQDHEVSPAWHREELHKRRSQVLNGTAQFQRWDDAMTTLRQDLRALLAEGEPL